MEVSHGVVLRGSPCSRDHRKHRQARETRDLTEGKWYTSQAAQEAVLVEGTSQGQAIARLED